MGDFGPLFYYSYIVVRMSYIMDKEVVNYGLSLNCVFRCTIYDMRNRH